MSEVIDVGQEFWNGMVRVDEAIKEEYGFEIYRSTGQYMFGLNLRLAHMPTYRAMDRYCHKEGYE